MRYSPESAAQVLVEARRVLEKDHPDVFKVELLWRTLAYLQASFLAALLRNTIGTQVYSGPFKGMKLPPEVMTGAFGPALTGCYEQELHATVARVIASPYARILNIGCAFGYYSVGLAMRMPQVKVHAFDIDEGEQKKCRDMAALNGVQDRVHVSGEFRGEDFASHADEKTLLIMDIEGAETALLDPARYPALLKMDVIVELHDVLDPSISRAVSQRFAPTHDIEIIRNKSGLFDFEPVTGPGHYMDPFDNLLINWENRGGPTPWAVMRAR